MLVVNVLSNTVCADITHHIANEMRKKLVNYILENDQKVGFMIDDMIPQ